MEISGLVQQSKNDFAASQRPCFSPEDLENIGRECSNRGHFSPGPLRRRREHLHWRGLQDVELRLVVNWERSNPLNSPFGFRRGLFRVLVDEPVGRYTAVSQQLEIVDQVKFESSYLDVPRSPPDSFGCCLLYTSPSPRD